MCEHDIDLVHYSLQLMLFSGESQYPLVIYIPWPRDRYYGVFSNRSNPNPTKSRVRFNRRYCQNIPNHRSYLLFEIKSDPEKHTKIPDNYIIGGLCTTKMVINHYRLWYPHSFSTAKTIFLRHDPSLRSSCPQCRVGHRVRHHEVIKTWNQALLSLSGVQKGKALYFSLLKGTM